MLTPILSANTLSKVKKNERPNKNEFPTRFLWVDDKDHEFMNSEINHPNIAAYKFAENFTVSKEFWEQYVPRILKTKSRTLSKGWTDDFNTFFQSKFKYCVLAVQDSRFYFEKQKNNSYFWASAICTHSSCTDFLFLVNTKIAAPYCDQNVK